MAKATTPKVADLTAFKRRFVRAKFGPECLLDGVSTQAELDAAQDEFFTGIVCAEMAAHHDEIDCAACGSKEICRTPLTDPFSFGTVTTASGHLYGYALCKLCNADRQTAIDRVDATFDEASGAAKESA
jgi:hypothetical protein